MRSMAAPAPWNQVEKRLAFYAGIIKHGHLQIPVEVAQRWRSALPGAIELEYTRISLGELPRLLTVATVLGDGGSEGQTGASERVPSTS